MVYRPRTVDRVVESKLATSGAILIEGPKAVGKTETARQHILSEVRLDTDPNAAALLSADPALLLEGATPRLLDEWQVGGTTLWNHVRRAVDDRGQRGQFILTGSATPPDDIVRHSGAGRMSTIRMRPMSLFESGDSSAEISLEALLNGDSVRCGDPGHDLARILDLIVRGGWPLNLDAAPAEALAANADYLTSVRETDIKTVTGARRTPLHLDRLLRSLARNTACEVKLTALAQETSPDEGPDVARTTIYNYLEALQRLMVVEDVPAWSPHLRSAATLRKEPKRHFADPCLATAALQASPERLVLDLNYAGFLFESLVVRDLRALAAPLAGEVFHYRDSNNVEADIVLTLPDGRWGAFEVKLGPQRVDEGAASILRFAGQIDTSKVGEPAVLGVITNATAGYRRHDGVCVIPIGALST